MEGSKRMSSYANSNYPTQGIAYPDQMQSAIVKDASVQDRLADTLGALTTAHAILDSIEGSASKEPSAPQIQMGLIGGALACAEQSARLTDRLGRLRMQLGNL